MIMNKLSSENMNRIYNLYYARLYYFSFKDVKIESDQEWEGLSAGEHLELISKEGMLSAVFVACDWMKREEEVIQLCVKTANSLWTAMAKLLNLLQVDLEQLKNSKDVLYSYQQQPIRCHCSFCITHVII